MWKKTGAFWIMRHLIILAGLMLAAQTARADESISDQIMKVQTRLEVINNLGRSCDYDLSVDGMKGAQSEDCQKYLNNMKGGYLSQVGTDCKALSEWYEAKRKLLGKPGFIEGLQQSDAETLARDMKGIQAQCNPDKYASSYPYLMKPLKKIEALSELQ